MIGLLRKHFFFITFLFSAVSLIRAQQAPNDSIAEVQLQEVEITALRQRQNPLRVPAALSLKTFSDSYTGGQRSLQEYLYQIPGLNTLNSSNYAQDLRISIRGFGSRAAFGIRGIKLVVDQIPETTPDGQGQLDNIPLDLIERISVLRGPSSLRFGNASGGVISIDTRDPGDEVAHRFSSRLGTYGQSQYTYSLTLPSSAGGLIMQLSHQKINGFRDHSAVETSMLNAKFLHRFNSSTKWVTQFNYTDSPLAEDPGAVNLTDFERDPLAARPQNEAFAAGERIRHYKIGSSLTYDFKGNTLSGYGFFSGRYFEGFLPFADGGAVILDRLYAGQGASVVLRSNLVAKWSSQWQIGYDWAAQKDNRKRYVNEQGQRGVLTLDQDERFSSFGTYAIYELNNRNFLAQLGLRYDANQLRLDDLYLSDSVDTSDALQLNAFSPQFGASYGLSRQTSLFFNASRAYETPALSELANSPSGDLGFNKALDVQRTQMFELGIRKRDQATQWELVLFSGTTTNDILPYELEAFPGRSFFRNTGSTQRDGVEASYLRRFKRLDIDLVYTYMKLQFSGSNLAQELEGNSLPGVPDHSASLQLSYAISKSTNLQYQRLFRGSLFADDANMHKVPSLWLDHFTVSRQIQWGQTSSRLAIGVQNLANVSYADNIRINAFGGRFYESGLPRQFFLSLSASL